MRPTPFKSPHTYEARKKSDRNIEEYCVRNRGVRAPVTCCLWLGNSIFVSAFVLVGNLGKNTDRRH